MLISCLSRLVNQIDVQGKPPIIKINILTSLPLPPKKRSNVVKQGFLWAVWKRAILVQQGKLEVARNSYLGVHILKYQMSNVTCLWHKERKATNPENPVFTCFCLPYARQCNPLLIRNRNWILTIHKAKGLRTWINFKNLVKSIQTAGYNGAHTVCCFWR